MEEAKATNVTEQFTLLVALVVVVMYGHVCMHKGLNIERLQYSIDCISSITDGIIIACLESCCYWNSLIIKI